MTRNSPELEQLILAEHSAVAPPEGSLEQGLGRFGQTLSAGLPMGLQVPIPSSASMATAGAGVAAKIGMVAAVTASVSLGVGLFVTQPKPAPEAVPTPALSAARDLPQPKPRSADEVGVIQETEGEIVNQPSPSPSPSRSAKLAGVDTFSLELELVQQARTQLSAGQPVRALQTLSQHQTRFPRGQLTQDRLALRALSLCQAGRFEEGRREADRLLKREPQSVYVDRLRSACR